LANLVSRETFHSHFLNVLRNFHFDSLQAHEINPFSLVLPW
jgi:hypothetical protein